MKKICVLLAILIILSAPIAVFASDSSLELGDTGDQVSQIQTWLRWLGYFNYRTTGRFSDLTKKSLEKFQSQNGLDVTGIADTETQALLFSTSAKMAKQNAAFVSVYGKRTIYPTQFGKVENWETISQILPVGTSFEVYDLYSDAVFNMVRTGGTNNARVTPASSTDADKFIAMCGGTSTWEKRPVKVSINGTIYAAAIFCSLNYAGDEEYGATQIYFSGSTSDLFGISDAEMDTAILRAGGEIN
jgi:hypothetical protein